MKLKLLFNTLVNISFNPLLLAKGSMQEQNGKSVRPEEVKETREFIGTETDLDHELYPKSRGVQHQVMTRSQLNLPLN
jgi:hypothetical protein